MNELFAANTPLALLSASSRALFLTWLVRDNRLHVAEKVAICSTIQSHVMLIPAALMLEKQRVDLKGIYHLTNQELLCAAAVG
eukprot:113183-Pelagomonas_calceolata.AAC.7